MVVVLVNRHGQHYLIIIIHAFHRRLLLGAPTRGWPRQKSFQLSPSRHSLLACSKFLKDLSSLSLMYFCTLSLLFTGGHPLAFPPSIPLTYTLLVIVFSSICSMLPNHFKVCCFTSSTTPHFFPSPRDTFQNTRTHFHYSFHPFSSHHKHSSTNSFPLPAP